MDHLEKSREPKMSNIPFTTKNTKFTKFGNYFLRTLRVLTAYFENTCAGMIRTTNWHDGSVIPAQAGIHPLPPLDAGLRQRDVY